MRLTETVDLVTGLARLAEKATPGSCPDLAGLEVAAAMARMGRLTGPEEDGAGHLLAKRHADAARLASALSMHLMTGWGGFTDDQRENMELSVTAALGEARRCREGLVELLWLACWPRG